MSDGIRGGGGPGRPLVPAPLERPATSDAGEAKALGTVPGAAPEAGADGARPMDVFENSGAGRAPRDAKVAPSAGRMLAEVAFNDQELAKVAATLVGLVKKNPKASRAHRAKAFTRALLRSGGRLAKIIEKMDEAEAERMFDDIATILADSPRLAEWIDKIGEEASRLKG